MAFASKVSHTLRWVLILCQSSMLALQVNAFVLRENNDIYSNDGAEVRFKIVENVPKRIYLRGNDILSSFSKKTFASGDNDIEIKFAYELVEPSACEMLQSTFGCCWDNQTVAFGVNGEGCPKCADQKRSCRKWKDMCHENVIKLACPQTCDICPQKIQKCEDEDKYCGLYKRFDLCSRKQIKKACRNTCDACAK